MLEDDTVLLEKTARAMREFAGTVTDAPPLRLEPGRAARAPRFAQPRRWTRWAVPLAAGVGVIALAIALVTVRDLSSQHANHPAGPDYPATAKPPTYYVAQENVCETKQCPPIRLVVGNTYTGAKLATLTPPPGTTFGTVSGAADDRTFVTDTVGFPVSLTAKTQHVTWYLITIRPGSPAPARLTRLPVPATPATANLESVSLSPSGRELAVLYHLGSQTTLGGTTVVRIYSVTTGRLLHSWSTAQKVLFSTYAFTLYSQSNTLLSWVDGNGAVTFMTTPYTLERDSNNEYTPGTTTVRVLDLAASGHDLLADSRVVWTVPTWHSGSPDTKASCGQETTAPSLVANGKTVVCIGLSDTQIGSGKKAPILWRLTWLSYETSAPTVGHVHYLVTSRNAATESGPNGNVLWTDQSGSTLLIAWAPYGPVNPVTHFGVVSHGKFIPLPTPPSDLLDVGPAIAW
jgi:hypothetical protein